MPRPSTLHQNLPIVAWKQVKERMAVPRKVSPIISLLLAHTFSIALCVVIVHGYFSFKDVTEALAFKGVYHRVERNLIKL